MKDFEKTAREIVQSVGLEFKEQQDSLISKITQALKDASAAQPVTSTAPAAVSEEALEKAAMDFALRNTGRSTHPDHQTEDDEAHFKILLAVQATAFDAGCRWREGQSPTPNKAVTDEEIEHQSKYYVKQTDNLCNSRNYFSVRDCRRADFTAGCKWMREKPGGK